jgi:hypothetical protein
MSDETVLSLIIPLGFLVCGIGLLTSAGVYLSRTRVFLAKAKETTGEVVALKEVPPTDTGESPTYRPVVLFQVGPRPPIRFESIAHSNPSQYKIGDSVPVLYDPESPYDARIRSFTSLWLLPLILGGLGLIFTAIGAGLLIWGIPS